MVNVLGEHVAPLEKCIADYPDWSIHLYGKAEVKEKRKMGHVTFVADSLDEVIKMKEQYEEELV